MVRAITSASVKFWPYKQCGKIYVTWQKNIKVINAINISLIA